MTEKVRRLDEMDPYSGKGDVEFKRAVLGATAILAGQPRNITRDIIDSAVSNGTPYDSSYGSADFVIAGVKDDSGKYVGRVEGSLDYNEHFVDDRNLEISTQVSLPQGSYKAKYEERPVRADEDGGAGTDEDIFVAGHGAGQVSRIVPIVQLPRHDRKSIDGTDESNRVNRDRVPLRRPLDYSKGDKRIPVYVEETLEAEREYVSKKEERAKAKRGSRGKTYYTKTIKDPRAAEIINHQAAKHLRNAAKQVRQRAIDEIESIDLGD